MIIKFSGWREKIPFKWIFSSIWKKGGIFDITNYHCLAELRWTWRYLYNEKDVVHNKEAERGTNLERLWYKNHEIWPKTWLLLESCLGSKHEVSQRGATGALETSIQVELAQSNKLHNPTHWSYNLWPFTIFCLVTHMCLMSPCQTFQCCPTFYTTSSIWYQLWFILKHFL